MERQMLSHMSKMSLGWFRLKHVPSSVLRYKFVTKKFGGGLAISICLPLLLLHSCVLAYSRTRLTLLHRLPSMGHWLRFGGIAVRVG
jgi:hypothetical protein